jgi:hypothetical protein
MEKGGNVDFVSVLKDAVATYPPGASCYYHCQVPQTRYRIYLANVNV